MAARRLAVTACEDRARPSKTGTIGEAETGREPLPGLQHLVRTLLSQLLRMVRDMQHSDECLNIRYRQLSSDDREYWPNGFNGRDDLCTCDANPHSAAKQPELAEEVAELRKYIESCERRYLTATQRPHARKLL